MSWVLDSDPDPYCHCGSVYRRAKINARIRIRKLVLPWFGNWYCHGLETGIAMVWKLALPWFGGWPTHRTGTRPWRCRWRTRRSTPSPRTGPSAPMWRSTSSSRSSSCRMRVIRYVGSCQVHLSWDSRRFKKSLRNRVADQYHVNADPGSAFHLKKNADPDIAFQLNADLDPAPHYKVLEICNYSTVLNCRRFRVPFWASRPLLWAPTALYGFDLSL